MTTVAFLEYFSGSGDWRVPDNSGRYFRGLLHIECQDTKEAGNFKKQRKHEMKGYVTGSTLGVTAVPLTSVPAPLT